MIYFVISQQAVLPTNLFRSEHVTVVYCVRQLVCSDGLVKGEL